MPKNKEKKITCKECGSAFIYIRIKKNEIVCRKCGNIEKKQRVKDARNK